MTVFLITSYLCWHDYVAVTIMPYLLVGLVQKCLKSWLMMYFMALPVEFMCFKAAPRRLCKWTCPALLTSEFVSVMVERLQHCTRGTVTHRLCASSCILPRPTSWDQPPWHLLVRWTDGKQQQQLSKINSVITDFRTEEDPFTDSQIHLQVLCGLSNQDEVCRIPSNSTTPPPPPQLSDSSLCWSWSIIMFNQHIDLLGLS